VFNFDLPFEAEDYVHRIGRTARLGAQGDAISFACERYAQGLPAIEAFIEQSIPVEPMTNEMLTAIPRAPRARVAGRRRAVESISDIFREARAEAEASGRGRAAPVAAPRSGSARPRGGPRREAHASACAAAAAAARARAASARAPSAARRAPRRNRRAPRAAARRGEAAKRRSRRRRGPRREGAPASRGAAPGDGRGDRAPAGRRLAGRADVSKESFLKRFTRSVRRWSRRPRRH
jgi:ATP-dependent RNA helicase RhlB